MEHTTAGQAAEVNAWKSKYEELTPQFRNRQERIAGLATELEEWKKRYAILERQMSRHSDAAPVVSSRPSRVATAGELKDNLQEIHGIGPVLEGTLNNLGIYRFQQIAELSSDEVTHIAEKLKTFPDRIKRDKWVDQARELHQACHARQQEH